MMTILKQKESLGTDYGVCELSLLRDSIHSKHQNYQQGQGPDPQVLALVLLLLFGFLVCMFNGWGFVDGW